MSKFGDALRGLRESKGISQDRLAKLVDYKRTNLSMIENGDRSASNELIKRLSLALGVSYEKLHALKMIDKMSKTELDALYEEIKKQKRLTSRNKDVTPLKPNP